MAQKKFPVYLVMPKVMMHREDGLYEELPHVCWRPFGPLWKSRSEAEAFAKQNMDKIQGADFLDVFTTKLAGSQFDCTKLSPAVQQELMVLLGVKDQSQWEEVFERFALYSYQPETPKDLRRILELLEIVPYRIVETTVTQKQFDSLSEAIAHYNGFESADSTQQNGDSEEFDEDVFDDEEESDEMKYLRPVGLAFNLARCPEDSIHPEQEFVDGNEDQAGDSGVFW